MGPTKAMTYQCPEPALSYIQEMRKKGEKLNALLTDMVLFAKTFSEEIGEWSALLEFEAKRRKVAIGSAAAQLIVERLTEKYPDTKGSLRALDGKKK